MRHLLALAFLAACNPLALDGAQQAALPTTGDLGRCEIAATCAGPLGDEVSAPCALEVTATDGGARYLGAAFMGTSGNGYTVELRTWSEMPVWPGASWRVLDDGSDPGADWREPGFDDAAWTVAEAPLVGDSPPVTTYFRLDLDVHSHEQLRGAALGLLANDGAAVYLNGVEILRENLAQSAGAATWATLPAENEDWLRAEFDAALLSPIANVLAVEVHQSAMAPEDLLFDLYLEGMGDLVAADLDGSGALSDTWTLSAPTDATLGRTTASCDLTVDGQPQGSFALATR